MNRAERFSESTPSPLARARQLLVFETRDIAVVAVYGVALGLLALAVPIAVQSLVDTVAFGSVVQPLVVLAALLGVALIGAAALRALQIRVVEMLQRRLFVRIVREIGYRLPRMNASALRRARGPELINRFFDVFTVQKSVSSLALGGIDAALVALIGLMVLAFYHPALLAFDVALIVAAFFVFVPLGRGGTHSSVAESKAKYAVAGWLEEMARHQLSFKLTGGDAFAQDRLEDLASDYLEKRDRHFRVVFRQVIGALTVEVVASVALLAIGGGLVIARQLTIGQLVAAELIVTAVVASLAKLGGKVEIFYDLVAAVDKLGEILDLPLERRHRDVNDEPELKPGLVSVEGLQLGDVTAGAEPWSATVLPYERVVLESNSEHVTNAFTDALFGLVEPSAGTIEVNGQDIRDVALAELRRRVGIFRDVEILPGTLLENLRAANKVLTVDEAWDALRRVGLEVVVKALPDGLHTELHTNGWPLSPSQALLLTLARVLASQPNVVVVDRAFDRLSRVSKEALPERLFKERDVTWIIVTEDSAFKEDSDRTCTWNSASLPEVAA